MTIPQQGSISLDSLPVGCVEEGVSVGAPCARERRRWWGRRGSVMNVRHVDRL